MNKFVAVAAGVAVAFGAVLVAPVSVYANDAGSVVSADGENASASFTKQIGEHVQLRWDADKRTVTVTGHGVFDRKAWDETLLEPNKQNGSNLRLQPLRVEFVPDAGKQIAFPADSSSLFVSMSEAELVWSANGIDTSNVTNMLGMFAFATSANPDVSNWDTSKVTNMHGMFWGATSADPDVSNWDTSKVTDMSFMFRDATSADPDVSNWDTSKVTNMSDMFVNAFSANPDVSNWDTSKVTNMHGMFANAYSANPDVSNWDTSKVTDMSGMFEDARSANPDVSNWDTSKVTDMRAMFEDARSANPDICGWDMSKVDYEHYSKAEYIEAMTAGSAYVPKDCQNTTKDKSEKVESEKVESENDKPEKDKSEKVESEKVESEKDRQLANTGAGGVVAPVAVAATLFAGAAVSALGLRRRRDG